MPGIGARGLCGQKPGDPGGIGARGLCGQKQRRQFLGPRVDAADLEGGAKLGIPEPELIDAPGASWRSRYAGQRWQVNAGHEDFAALAGEPRARLRYLLTLLAKEIVARTHGGPGADNALEGLVEILAHTERNLRGG